LVDLFEAITHGDVSAAQTILDRDPAASTAVSEQGVSALMMALYHQKPEIADLIASAREEVSVPLNVHELACLGKAEGLTALLEAGDIEVDERSPDGFVPLHFAAFFGNAASARVLIERGASVNAVAENPTRVQPLHSAVAHGDVETVALLLARGAEVNARQQNDLTPLMGAAFAGSVEMVKRLLAAGADASAVSGDGKTAADLARERGNDDALSLL
jgi:ankyrin repeat protein